MHGDKPLPPAFCSALDVRVLSSWSIGCTQILDDAIGSACKMVGQSRFDMACRPHCRALMSDALLSSGGCFGGTRIQRELPRNGIELIEHCGSNQIFRKRGRAYDLPSALSQGIVHDPDAKGDWLRHNQIKRRPFRAIKVEECCKWRLDHNPISIPAIGERNLKNVA